MEIELDVEKKMLNGHTTLIWKNTGSKPVGHMEFHLYYNAFKNSNSTFFREGGVPSFWTENIDEACGWGWTRLTQINDAKGNDLSANISYIQPDDNNRDDETVLKLDLAESVPAGETTTITFDWEARVPKTMPRTGYNKDYFFFAQWFPKVGVYETAGMRYATEDAWNCHQYHASGEYYSDFGVYEVLITLPDDYVVAASGKQTALNKANGKKTWTFKAEDVIDFTWSASPQYVINEEKHNDTEIRLYSYPEKQHFSTRYLTTIKFCMQYLEDVLGPYPYPTLSIVDPPIFGLFTGGMEYPTLITSLSMRVMPDGFKTTETLVVHEFIHQYFMQMVATHEVEEPWMDEGFTSYYEGRIMNALLGEKTSAIDFFGVTAGNKEWNRSEFFNSDIAQVASNARKSWQYKHGGYGPISYNKTALWIETLEGLVGVATMDEIFRTYFEKWKFKHPARGDFIEVVNSVVIKNHADRFSQGMDWYFEQVLYGTGLCDYKVASIENEEVEKQRGFIAELDDCSPVDAGVNYKYDSSVILHRLGEIKIPIDIKVTTEDGAENIYQWDGQERSSEINIQSNSKIVSVCLDPNNKNPLDHNLLNNSLKIKRQEKAVMSVSTRLVTAFQHLLEIVTLIC